MIALILVALGAVAGIVGTSVLAARSARGPRVYLIAWSIALFGLAVGLAAAVLGLIGGFGEATFRAMELGTGLLAPLGFSLALIEMTGTRLASRFAMRLAVSGLVLIGITIMGTDPINPNATFSTSWPDPASFYQLAPLTVLGFLAVLTAVTAVAVFAVVLRRSSRERLPRGDSRPVVLLAVAALVVVLPGLVRLLRAGTGIELPQGGGDLFALCSLAAAVLGWYAGKVAGSRDLASSSAVAGHDDDDDARYDRGDRDSYRGYETGEFDGFGRGGRPGAGDEYEDGYGSRRPAGDLAGFERADSEIRYPALAALAVDPAELADERGLYRDQDLYREPDDRSYDQRGSYDQHAPYDEAYADGDPYTGEVIDDRGRFPDQGPYAQHGGRAPYEERGRFDDYDRSRPQRGEPRGELFGQITIYTLIEGLVDEFDRLTERVVGLVQDKEPDTLVYIVHAVPTAPMQRILYEVYRDRAAQEEHMRRGYMVSYEADQRPFVLATNVIELGLQQAKVSPLPTPAAISDILSESGIDLTGITRSAQSGFSRSDDPRRGPAQSGQHQGPDYETQYQGWTDLRGEDGRYR